MTSELQFTIITLNAENSIRIYKYVLENVGEPVGGQTFSIYRKCNNISVQHRCLVVVCGDNLMAYARQDKLPSICDTHRDASSADLVFSDGSRSEHMLRQTPTLSHECKPKRSSLRYHCKLNCWRFYCGLRQSFFFYFFLFIFLYLFFY